MRSEIERRASPERRVVVGVAPGHRADAAGATERIETGHRVRSCGVLVDEQRTLPVSSAAGVGGQTELREEDVTTVTEPARQAGEEREQLLVSRTGRPRCVDRVAVHRK